MKGKFRKNLRHAFAHMRNNYAGITYLPVTTWYLKEIGRRSRLKDFAGRCPVCLASYPRSGNHAVRSLIELAFARPTLGTGDSEQWRFPRWLVDRPIGLRLDPPVAYVSQSPVAVKRHEFLEMDHWDYLIQIT